MLVFSPSGPEFVLSQSSPFLFLFADLFRLALQRSKEQSKVYGFIIIIINIIFCLEFEGPESNDATQLYLMGRYAFVCYHE